MEPFRIFTGNANRGLAQAICNHLKSPLGDADVSRFEDGEVSVKFNENIRGTDVFIVQSTGAPAENLMELLVMLDAAKRASARRVTAVLPYFGYARQDRKDQPRVPITASETLATRFAYREFISRGAIGIVMPDLSWIGGISEARKVASLAEANHLPIAPHDCTGPIVYAASVHLALNATNTLVQESVRAFYTGWYKELVTELPRIVDVVAARCAISTAGEVHATLGMLWCSATQNRV